MEKENEEQLMDRLIKEAKDKMKETNKIITAMLASKNNYFFVKKPELFYHDPEAIAAYERQLYLYEHPEELLETYVQALIRYEAAMEDYRAMTEKHIEIILNMEHPRDKMEHYYYEVSENRGTAVDAENNWFNEHYNMFLMPYFFIDDEEREKTLHFSRSTSLEGKFSNLGKKEYKSKDIFLLCLADIQDDAFKLFFISCGLGDQWTKEDKRKYFASIIATINGDSLSLALLEAFVKILNPPPTEDFYETYVNEREYYKQTLKRKRELTERDNYSEKEEGDFWMNLVCLSMISEEDQESIVELWKKERTAIFEGKVEPFQKSRKEMLAILLPGYQNSSPTSYQEVPPVYVESVNLNNSSTQEKIRRSIQAIEQRGIHLSEEQMNPLIELYGNDSNGEIKK